VDLLHYLVNSKPLWLLFAISSHLIEIFTHLIFLTENINILLGITSIKFLQEKNLKPYKSASLLLFFENIDSFEW